MKKKNLLSFVPQYTWYMHIGTQGTYRGPEKDRHCIEGGQEDEGVCISSSEVYSPG